MELLPLISTTFIVISAILVGIGWYHIVKGNRATHEKFMIAGAIFALAFFIVYMSRTLLVGNTAFSEAAPDWVRASYHVFLIFHIFLATVSAVFGLVTLYNAFKKNFTRHKKVGKITAILWLMTAPTGLLVFLLLYVIYPGGETKPVQDVILGR